MIRKANKFDIPKLVDLVLKFGHEFENALTSDPLHFSEEHIKGVLSHILAGIGFILIDEENNGVLIACKMESFWVKTKFQLHEVLLRADNKITTVKLVKEYIKIAQDMVDSGQITNAIIAAHPSVDYSKLGARKMEVNWEIR